MERIDAAKWRAHHACAWVSDKQGACATCVVSYESRILDQVHTVCR